MRDLRYLHHLHTETVERGTGVAFYTTYPGWIDADVYPWAKALRMPGDCDDLFCPCHTPPKETK